MDASELAGMGLSKQTVQALVAAKINTRAQLEARRETLGQIKGIGPQTERQILDLLGPAVDKPQDPPATGMGAEDEPTEGTRPRQGEVVVMCPYCNVKCTSNRSDPMFTRYYCPNNKKGKCNFSQKVPRPDIVQRAHRLRNREEDFSARA